jgi:hypothetical protein
MKQTRHPDYKKPLLNGNSYISVQRPPSANPGYMEE